MTTTRTRPTVRDRIADTLLVAALFAIVPTAILAYIAAGQAACITALVVALALCAAGWAVGR